MENLEISQVEVYVVAGPAAKYYTSSHFAELDITNTIVRVTTKEGLEGVGGAISWTEGGIDRSLAESIRHILPHLIGKSALHREEIWAMMMNRCVMLAPQAQSPIDIALWDLAAKHAGMPLYQMLGGARRKILSYASTPFLPSVGDYLDYVGELSERGYKAIKFHTWCNIDQDLEMVHAVHEKYKNSGLKFMIDVEQRYNHNEALRAAKELQELGYVWFEAPLPDTDLEGYRELKSHVHIPILPAGNSIIDLRLIEQGIQKGCWSSARVDTTLAGGITSTRKIMSVAEANGMNVELQSWGYTLSQAANLHMMLAANNCEYFEQAVPEEPLEFGSLDVIRTDSEGYVHAPSRPGLGIRMDWELIEKTAIAKIVQA